MVELPYRTPRVSYLCAALVATIHTVVPTTMQTERTKKWREQRMWRVNFFINPPKSTKLHKLRPTWQFSLALHLRFFFGSDTTQIWVALSH